MCERMKADGLPLPLIAQALLDAGYDSYYKTHDGSQYYFDLTTNSYKELPTNPNCIYIATEKSLRNAVVKENASASLVDLGDGVLCAEFHSKMNTIDPLLLEILRAGVDWINEGKYEGMVVGNQGEHFSAGANLFLILAEIKQGNWKGVEMAVRDFQRTNMAMRFCRGPVVAAPHHYTFGGGIEMCQHAARTVIAGETYGGLVEAGVGVIPAGGGTKEMLRRALAYVPPNVPDGDPFPYVRRAFETIGMAKVSTSGPELVDLGYFTDKDLVCVNFDHQIKKAKDVCIALCLLGYTPPTPAKLVALGESVTAALRIGVHQLRVGGYATEHDAVIAEHLANVLTGWGRPRGTPMTEQDVLDLECEAFCSLCGTEKTQARMEYMLKTGRPLRN